MKIAKIIVNNYRSIEKAEIEVSKFSIFVGQNNHGKTNFFEAIEWFYTSKSTNCDEKFKKDDSKIVSVELYYEDVIESDIEKMTTDASKTKIRDILNGNNSFSIKKTSQDHKRRYFVNGEDKGNPQGLDTAINEFIPKLEYVNTKIKLDDVSKYKDKNPIGTMLSGVLLSIIETSQEYAEFKNQFSRLFDDENSEVRKELNLLGGKVELYLQKQFPDGTSVKFQVNQPNFTDLLKSFDTSVNDGIETKAEDKGDGMQRAIMLSIIQAFADYRKEHVGGGNFLFLIDEAELHLHPSAQRLLKNALCEISESDQVFVNTHSSVLVADNIERQKIFKVEKIYGITEINEVFDIDKMNIVYELLGGSPIDLLLPRNFIIVEGRSEFEFINIIIKRFYQDKFKGIKVIFAGGDIIEQERSINSVHKLLIPLTDSDNPIYKEKVIILIDKPNQDQQNNYDRFKNGYPYLYTNGQVFEIDNETLEEYYPNGYKKTRAEIITSEKVAYAKLVAEKITQEQFENEMPVIYNALEQSNLKGFNSVV